LPLSGTNFKGPQDSPQGSELGVQNKFPPAAVVSNSSAANEGQQETLRNNNIHILPTSS